MNGAAATQQGRCGNLQLCAAAAARSIITVPAGEDPACPRCGQPLQPLDHLVAPPRSMMPRVVQGAVVLAGVVALVFRITSGEDAAWLQSKLAPTTEVNAAPRSTAAAGGANIILRVAATDALGPGLVPQFAAKHLGLLGITDIASLPGADGTIEVSGQQAGERDGITVAAVPAAAGFDMLRRGTVDALLSTSRMPDAEGAPAGGPSPAAIAIQGITVAVSPANPVASLTPAQLQDVFAGRTVDWKDLGGPAGPIHIYLARGRNAISPDEAGFGQVGPPPPGWIISEQAAAAVTADHAGLVLLPLGSTGAAKVLPLGSGGTAVAPDRKTLLDGTYPLTRRLFLYLAPSTGNAARRFAGYIRSPAGLAELEASGFAPLPQREEAAPPRAVPEVPPDRMRPLLAGTAHLGLDVHFPQGGRDLDRASTHDLDQLIAFVRTQRIAPARLIVVGVPDGALLPPGQSAQTAALQRAGVVAAVLTRSGLPPGKVVTASPAAMPSNGSNHLDEMPRVEIYLMAQ